MSHGHSIIRTSPKGGPFIGTCSRCGRTGLTVKDMGAECANVRGISDDDALLEAIPAPPHPPTVGEGE
jgi:hypothetical protein